MVRFSLILVLCLVAVSADAQLKFKGGVLKHGTFGTSSVFGSFGDCTDGVDCYCDKAAVTGDTSLILCEDFENPDYYATTNWVAGTGSGASFNRGASSDWNAVYDGCSFGSCFRASDPSPARVGTTCGSGIGGSSVSCEGQTEYCSAQQGNLVDGGGADCWEVNSRASMDIQRDEDFKADNGSLTLTGGNSGGGDVFSGKAHFAFRVPINGSDNGLGERNLGGNYTEVGITMAHGYGSNQASTGVEGQPWKHEEWYGAGNAEHWNLGYTGAGGSGSSTYRPYLPFLWTTSVAACEANFSSVIVHVGSATCLTGSGIGFSANGNNMPTFATAGTSYENSGVTNYNRSQFPDGTWQCHRAHISGMGTSNVELKIWHNDALVIHASNIPGSILTNSYYSRFWWNAYSNQAQGAGLAQVAWKYRDNVHIRNGAPVSCDSIGF